MIQVNLFAKQTQRYRQREQMYGHHRARVGGMNWEITTGIYTLLCITYITNENLLYSTGNSTQYSWSPK